MKIDGIFGLENDIIYDVDLDEEPEEDEQEA